jgi:feruloyl esterase
MPRQTLCLPGILVAAALISIGNQAFAQMGEPQSCEALASLQITADALRLPTGGVTLTEVVHVAAAARTTDEETGEAVLELPVHCRVQGAIAPIDPEAPPILFNVNLPADWNGKALQSGGGGLGGSRNTSPGSKASGRFDPQPYTDNYPLTDGYVTFGGDEGHQGGDVGFMYNEEALVNWAGESQVKVRDVAVELIESAYGRAPEYVYFSGESAGGREAAIVAQRYPDAYDGVIAVTPVLGWTYIHIGDNRMRTKLVDGWLDEAAISLIADRTRALCDDDDGLVDGIIARYMECRMDSETLRCPDGDASHDCLTGGQIAALDSIREPWSSSVPFAHGIDRFPGFGVTGDENNPDNQYSFYTVGTTPPVNPLPPGRGFQPGLGAIINFGAVWVRHGIVQDETFDPYRFYVPAYADRIQYLSGLFDATDPDLSAFRARGGKLIILQQSADNAVSTPMVAEYYRSVIAELGEAAAEDVIRLYIGPGGTHNGTGVAQLDALGLLEAWVEKGEAPPKAVPIHDIDPVTLENRRSMVACVYPSYTRYSAGDVNESSSYECADRQDPLGYRSSAP